MPDNFKLIDSLHMAYVIFPSVAAATKVLEQLGGVTYLNGNYYRVEFTPDLNQVSNKTGMTYVQNVNDKTSAYTTSLETTVLEDWICEFVPCFIKIPVRLEKLFQASGLLQMLSPKNDQLQDRACNKAEDDDYR